MKNYEKYEKTYFLPPKMTYEWAKKDYIDKAPIWCSVDLRDGNQALIEPMGLEEKIEFFKLLVAIGFKEIEVGFPAASETEYVFLRTLIEENMIPDDVRIQVLTQSREHIIRKTFKAVTGAKNAVIHLYNSTSVAQREQVFKKTKEEVKKIAVSGAKLLNELAKETPGNFLFQYSPESFQGTEVEYALEVCNAVLKEWEPSKRKPMIINIPTTVENLMPHVFATQIEYINSHLYNREHVILSLHPHNDRGCAISDAEMGLLAGADRIEGTLFGNGERTGNVDLITLGMNLFSHGVDPKLDFSNLNALNETYERLTGMHVYERQPYSGKLVFTAFSGSHQDAIAKGMEWRKNQKADTWSVPYLPIDPEDIGRSYSSDVIRINSQSGKGGVSYILQQNYGIQLPREIMEEVGYLVKDVSDKEHKELSPTWVYKIFEEHYIKVKKVFQVEECHFKQVAGMLADVTVLHGGGEATITATGTGRLDAVSKAIKQYFKLNYDISFYEEHSLRHGSSAEAVAYVRITYGEHVYWGVGIDPDIIKASIEALVVAVNKIEDIHQNEEFEDKRLLNIIQHIQSNYKLITLETLAEEFYLSTPYLSKYLKEKTGTTFTGMVKRIRLKKARIMLKTTNITVENIANEVGYPTVEHFNRLFRREYNMTPLQYRKQQIKQVSI